MRISCSGVDAYQKCVWSDDFIGFACIMRGLKGLRKVYLLQGLVGLASIAREPRAVDVRVQVGFEIVVARHGVLLAALLVQAHP
jgi:hypothetical protein